MFVHTNHEVAPLPTVTHVVHRTVALRRRALDPLRSRDPAARSAASRRFLRRTQDVLASSVDYPGGLPTLIRDREMVTRYLVRLLRND